MPNNDGQSVTDVLITALEDVEGVEHVIVILDKGPSCRIIGDSAQTAAEMNFNLDIAKLWLMGKMEGREEKG